MNPSPSRARLRAAFATVGVLVLAGVLLEAPGAWAEGEPAAPTATAISATSGHTSQSRQLVLTGTGLDQVTGVQFGRVDALNLQLTDAQTLAFTLPPAYNFQPGTVAVSLRLADDAAIPTALSYRFSVTSRVDRQMDYAFDHVMSRGTSRYVYIPRNDCANFTSQTLAARGWSQTSKWYNRGGWSVSRAWVSSTALRKFVRANPSRGTELTDLQRDQVRIGDIVQFDWDNSGDRDHTAIISRITTESDGHISLFYVAHTAHVRYRSVDWAITTEHPGASVYYFRLN